MQWLMKLKPPPNPPSDNGDRVDRPADPLVEAKTKAKRRMSDKQLENLRRRREAKAAKAKAKLEPQAPEPSFLPSEGVGTPPAPEPLAPEPKAKPKPKSRAKPQPKPHAQDQYVTPTYVPSVNFSVF